MKNDIIGTFGILFLGVGFLFFAKNYSGGELWMPDAMMINSGSNSAGINVINRNDVNNNSIGLEKNNEGILMDNSISAPLPRPANKNNTQRLKANSELNALGFLLPEWQVKFGIGEKAVGDFYKSAGDVFLWPDKKESNKFSYVSDVSGLVMEKVYTGDAKKLNEMRVFTTSKLKKIGFKQVKFKNIECKSNNYGGLVGCLDYYQRGQNEYCMTMEIIAPFDVRDVQKKAGKVTQFRIICGG